MKAGKSETKELEANIVECNPGNHLYMIGLDASHD